MKISVEDGIVVCSLEDKDEVFLSISHGCFKGYYNDKLKIAMSAGQEMETPEIIDGEIKLIQSIMYYRNKRFLHVQMDEVAVYGRLKALRQALDKLNELARLELQRQKDAEESRAFWQKLCEKGCGDCKHKKRCGDDQRCAISGDLLEEKHEPKYINGVHYLFNYEAYPTDNCPFKTN